MTTPDKGRAKFGRQLDSFVLDVIPEVIGLVLMILIGW